MKAVIFDMDGVLVSTPLYACRSANKALEKYGISFSEEEFKEYQGVSARDRVKVWNERFGTNIDLELFTKTFIETQLELIQHELEENKEIKSLIEQLKREGYKIAVATASKRYKAEKILRILGILDELEILITSDEVNAHKPDPEIYLTTAKKIGVEPEECTVIEDSPKGIQSGKNAKMRVIALQTPLFKQEELSQADQIINQLSEIQI